MGQVTNDSKSKDRCSPSYESETEQGGTRHSPFGIVKESGMVEYERSIDHFREVVLFLPIDTGIVQTGRV
jgi:hypothetical protein